MTILVADDFRAEPILDQTVIARYRQRRVSFLDTLVDVFLQEAPGYFQSLRRSLAEKDLSSVRGNAHGLKSVSYNLGALRLAKVCLAAETAAAEGRLDEASSISDRIGPVLFDTEEALKGVRSRQNV